MPSTGRPVFIYAGNKAKPQVIENVSNQINTLPGQVER